MSDVGYIWIVKLLPKKRPCYARTYTLINIMKKRKKRKKEKKEKPQLQKYFSTLISLLYSQKLEKMTMFCYMCKTGLLSKRAYLREPMTYLHR